MDYFKTDNGLLVQYNQETKVYKIRTSLKREDTRLSEADFLLLNPVRISKKVFFQQMNVFYNDAKSTWDYKGRVYRKLDNFEVDSSGDCTNYNIGDMPRHSVRGIKDLLLVYHWGKVYYFKWSYNGYPSGILVDPKTHQQARWAKPKNCAPVFDVLDKRIM